LNDWLQQGGRGGGEEEESCLAETFEGSDCSISHTAHSIGSSRHILDAVSNCAGYLIRLTRDCPFSSPGIILSDEIID
jgi:hypothetical protein